MNDLLVQLFQPSNNQGDQPAFRIRTAIMAIREKPIFGDPSRPSSASILLNLLEALISTLMQFNKKYYSRHLLNIDLLSSAKGIIPGYKYYQGRQFSISDGKCDWFIATNDREWLDIPTAPNALFRESPPSDWSYYGQSAGRLRYRFSRGGTIYELSTVTPLIHGRGFLSLASNITGSTLGGIIQEIIEKLNITSSEGLLHFNNPSDWYQAISPPFKPSPESCFHSALDQSGYMCVTTFPYKNPNGSIRGFVTLYSHKEYGNIFIPLTCWFHKRRHNDIRWVHLGFKTPILWHLDMIEQNPNATIYIFDNELLACEFGLKLHQNDALIKNITTSWPGGKHTLAQVDFSPLRDRHVVRVEKNNEASHALTELMVESICAVTSNFTIKTAKEF